MSVKVPVQASQENSEDKITFEIITLPACFHVTGFHD